MKELDAVIRAAVAVVKARREARRATQDGASEDAQRRYGKAFSKALDGLDAAVVAFGRKAPSPAPGAAKSDGWDWAGIAKAGIAVAKAVNRAKREGRPVASAVGDIIDAEIVE